MSEDLKKQPFLVAIIAKDAVEQLPVTVMAHELLVLVAVHGQDRVFVDENADLPNGLTEGEFDPEEEFARLEQRYGDHPDTKQSYATMAFGGFRGFEDFLENEAVGHETKPRRRGAAKAEKATKAEA